MESYLQAFGRAGRDCKNSEALLLFHGHQLRLSEPEMPDFSLIPVGGRKFWNSLMIPVAIKASYQTINSSDRLFVILA